MLGESKIDLWWKNALIYCLDVEVFLDSNGDGIGDFKGLTERVDYLAGLGVTCIWLMPFYPSAQRDDGYDITDFYSVDPRLGDLGSFTEFIQAAQSHGMRVIADLVVNHTSDQHPWFQSARSSPDSPYRDFYIWKETKPDDPPSLVFPGEQQTNWTYDEVAKQYYFHHFYPHQPDLNPANPDVADAMKQIMGFWVQQGMAGFRVDAVPFLIEMQDKADVNELSAHDFLRDLRAYVARRRGDSALLGEVNLLPHETVEFFGNDDELEMVFNFYVNQHLFLALAREDPDPLRKALDSIPPIPKSCQWAQFLKNHDEANLDKLTEAEQGEVYARFAPQKSMQLFGRGIRRRLPAMLDGDQRRIRMAYSLLFSLPGTPVLFYGEEIGMHENLKVEGRLAVRTPMQWKAGPQGGFTTARPQDAVRPIPTGPNGSDGINVIDQRRNSDSMLNWMERLIRRRKETAEFGFGKSEVLEVGEAAVFAQSFEWDGRVVIALHNFSDQPRVADVSGQLPEDLLEIAEIWSDGKYPAVEKGRVRLQPYGYRWLRILKRGQELLM